MTESRARLVDSLCKIIATLALVVGGGWTLYTYFNARAKESHTAAIEAKKPFLAKRLEIYGQLVDLSAQIAYKKVALIARDGSGPKNTGTHNTPANQPSPQFVAVDTDEIELQHQYRRFLELNVGSMALVEDKTVEDAVMNFRKCYRNKNCSGDEFLQGAANIAHACRNSIGAEWQVNVSNSAIGESELEN